MGVIDRNSLVYATGIRYSKHSQYIIDMVSIFALIVVKQAHNRTQ